MMLIPTFEHVLKAYERIKPYIYLTPVLTSEYLNYLSGAELFFKCENFQKTGVFKLRGASNAVLGTDKEKIMGGVVTRSSGNHGAALSYIANKRNIPATVVMQQDASEVKKEAIRNYGGKIIECGNSVKSQERVVKKLISESGGEFIHPYNDPMVIAGQATCAYEFVRQNSDLDAIITPIGGGGLVSGTCITINKIAPKIKVYAAEPQNGNEAYQSMKSGRIVACDAPKTIADGLKAPIKELTWYFVSKYIEDIMLATEEEIINAMKIVFQTMKIIIEPSSAVPLATILKNKSIFAKKRVGIIVTGSNVDLDKLPWSKNVSKSREN